MLIYQYNFCPAVACLIFRLLGAVITSSGALLGKPDSAGGGNLWPTVPVPCRDDLAVVAQQHFNKTGWAVEIGVHQGRFAAKNLQHWRGRYYMIDAWAFNPDGSPDCWDCSENMRIAKARVRFAGGRARVIRAFSLEAAKQFANQSFDWIYLDALHTYEAVSADLAAWYPKLRHGGLFSGDDYSDMHDTPLMAALRYQQAVARIAQPIEGHTSEDIARIPSKERWGTIRAVNRFARRHGHQLFVTWLSDCYAFPAWYMIKA